MNKSKFFIFLLLMTLFNERAKAYPYNNGEELSYSLRYKYGLVMVRAGRAKYTLSYGTYRGVPTFNSDLYFSTTPFFDGIFKVRDSLHSSMSRSLFPFYCKRYINEGKANYSESLYFRRHGVGFSEASSSKFEENGEREYEVMLKSDGPAFDILNILTYCRALSYGDWLIGHPYPMYIFIGRRVSKIHLRYMGKVIYEKSGDLKYRALKIDIEIVDEAFHSSQKSMEVWLSDDENRVPLKIKAKLRIGAAEAYLVSSRNLKVPLRAL